MTLPSLKPGKHRDPRDYQLMVLGPMLLYGVFWLKFDLNLAWVAGIIATAQLTQYLATLFFKIPRFEWKSAMISGLSLSILMRCSSLPISLLLAAAAILSKFTLRWKGKHVFNPTNFALVLGILGTNVVRINPGQWGSTAFLLFFILAMGMFVVTKACRRDVSLAFLAVYALALCIYAIFVGNPLSTVLTRLQSGSLLIFTFFMISDPKTTPDSGRARLAFGAIVALGGAYLQLVQSTPAGLLISLAFLSLAVPVLDAMIPGEKYSWDQGKSAA